jgi:hypothetical protein
MDCRGIGDSTGVYLFELFEPPVEEAGAILRMARSIVGAVPVAIVGNCLGARTAFALAATMRDCAGIACILETSLAPLTTLGRSPGARPARTRVSTRLKRRARTTLPGISHRLARLLRPARTRLPSGGMPALIPQIGLVASRVPVLVLECGTVESGAAIRHALDRISRPPDVVTVPTRGTAGIRPLVTQDSIRSHVVDWMDQRFAGRSSADGAAS